MENERLRQELEAHREKTSRIQKVRGENPREKNLIFMQLISLAQVPQTSRLDDRGLKHIFCHLKSKAVLKCEKKRY